MSGIVVGIDLGTSNSVVAAMVNGQPVVIPDEDGRKLQSSVVAFLDDGTVLVGNRARELKVVDPVNTVYSAKRLIGRPFHSNEVRVAQTHYPYELFKGDNDAPKIIAKNRQYSPEEVSAMVLQRMRQIAENYLGQRVDSAVVTVPANFNESQRSATKLAGEIAGLNILRILNEPTAAALAYGYGLDKRERVAIYDFGGGTFDVTVLDLRGSVFEVLSTAGNTYLGGDDFDNRLVDFMVAAFEKKHGVNLAQDQIALERLKATAERVKIELSYQPKSLVHISERVPGQPTPAELKFSIDRNGFNQHTQDIVQQTFLVCDDALRLAELTTQDVDHVVLVGGSTRIPLVRQMVTQYFFLEPVGDINPDEVVAMGAAIYAAGLDAQIYGDGSGQAIQQALLIDVTPTSLGIGTAGGYCDKIIERNENIPTERTRIFATSRDYQDSVRLTIFEGESNRADENRPLGQLILENIRQAYRGEVKIEVTFEIDTDGILNVRAVDLDTQQIQQVRLQISGELSDADKERLQAERRDRYDEEDNPDNLPVLYEG